MFLLVALSVLVFVTSAAVVVRARFSSAAEDLLAVTAVWSALVLTPIHALGLLNKLTAPLLAALVIVTCAVVGGATFRGVDRVEHARAVRASIEAMVRLPWRGVIACWEAKSFALVGLIAALGIIVYTLWLSYLLPSSSWDGLWYHELTVGYAIQNHGYAPIDLPTSVPFPMNMIQVSNGYPRHCEMTSLWFVIFSGRDLVEAPNSFAAIPLILGTYCIARRTSVDRVAPIAWGSAVLLMPAASMQLRSTYLDLHMAAFFMMALHFCTKPRMRVADAWLAMLSLGLLIGTKSTMLASVPVLWAVAAGLVVHHNYKAVKAATIGAVAGGTAIIAAFASVCYVRNLIVWKNPLWPMTWESKLLGIHFKGLAPIDAIINQLGDVSFWQGVRLITALRVPGKDFADTGAWGYGDGVVFVLIPVGLAAMGWLAVSVTRIILREGPTISAAVAKEGSEPAGEPSDTGPSEEETLNMVLITAVLGLVAVGAPRLWYPRYNLHLAAGLMLVVHWMSRRARALSEVIPAIIVVTGLIFLYRASPGWGVSFSEALAYARMPVAERDARAPTDFTISPEVARARDRELTEGTVTVYAVDVVFPFVSQLWNRDYTNKLYWAESRTIHEFLDAADRRSAKWVVAGETGHITKSLRTMPDRWQEIGLASRNEKMVAFRRVR